MWTKNVKNWIFVLLMALTTPFITSCGDDEDDFINPFSTPQFEDVSGRYSISNPSSPYAFVELFASGQYLIVKRSIGYNYETSLRCTFSTRAAATRVLNYDNMIYGNFQKVDNENFQLEGFGRLQLKTTGDQGTEIVFQPQGGQEEITRAEKVAVMSDDERTNALCRTWKMVRLRERGYDRIEGDYDDIYTPDMIDPELIVDITFSKSGTYMNTYQDGSIWIANWKWENIGKGIIRSSLDNVWYNGDEGNATVTFSEGNKVTIVEYGKDHETDEWYEITVEAVEEM